MATRFSASLTFTALAAVATLALTRCAVFGPSESFDRADDYKVSPPENWVSVDRGEADRAYRTRDKAIVTLTTSCTRPTDATLEQLTRHLLFGLRHQKTVEQQRTTVSGLGGLRTRVDATLEGKPVHLEVVVARKDICVFDFSLASPHALTSEDRQAFQKFVASFRLGKGGH